MNFTLTLLILRANILFIKEDRMKNLAFHKSWQWIFALLAIGILHKLSILPPVETGQDAVQKWLMMKSLWWSDIENTHWVWNHHSARWIMNIPALAITYFFGESVNLYYVTPLAAYSLTIFFIYKICDLSFNDYRRFLVPLCFIFVAQYSRYANQLIPAVFSNAFVTGSFYFLLVYLKRDRVNKDLFLSIIFLFCAYLAKIDNVYFMFPFLLILYTSTKNLKAPLQFAFTLFLLYVIETACYAVFTEYNFGRLQILLGTHVKAEKRLVSMTFATFINRLTVPGSPVLYFIFIFVISIPFIVKRWSKQTDIVKYLFWVILIYYFLKMVILKSYFPPVPLEVTKERYMLAPVPLLMVFLFGLFSPNIISKVKSLFSPNKLTLLSVLLISFFSIRNLAQISEGSHRLQKNVQLKELLNKAFENNIPIVSDHYKNIWNVHRYYLDKKLITEDGKYLKFSTSKMNVIKTPFKSYEGRYNIYLKDKTENTTLNAILSQCHLFISDKYYKFETKNCENNSFIKTYSY